jgi:hypothetical protein
MKPEHWSLQVPTHPHGGDIHQSLGVRREGHALVWRSMSAQKLWFSAYLKNDIEEAVVTNVL